MVQIEITKQPLYGSVYWNGYEFIYTPKQGYTGNDVYFYTKIENGVSTSCKNYVNPTNIAPVSNNPTLTADAYTKTEISINALVEDSSDPFNDLKIVKVSDPIRGKIENTGKSLYYYPDAYNSVETIEYTVSDREYSTTGVLTLSVINGVIRKPIENETFKYRLNKAYNTSLTIPPLTSNWESSYNVFDTYFDVWNSIDIGKYINLSNYVEAGSADLINLYGNKLNYDSVYTILVPNSSTWINDRNIIDVVNDNSLNLINTYDILSNKNTTWDTDYINSVILSGVIDDSIVKIQPWSQLVTDNLSSWDSHEIYHTIEDNKEKWDTAYNDLSTNGEENKWLATTETVTSFSSIYDSPTADNLNYTSTYNIVSSLSDIWRNLDAETILLSADKWNELSNNNQDYLNLYNLVSTNSGLWIKDKTFIDYIQNNKLNLINTYDALTSKNIIWNNDYNNIVGLSATFNEITQRIESLTDVVNDNLSIWNNHELSDIIQNNKEKWDSTFIELSTNAKEIEWNNSVLITSSFSSAYAAPSDGETDFTSTYNIVSSLSDIWRNTDTETILLSADKWNELSNNNDNFLNLYNLVSTNSGLWIKDDGSTYNEYTLLSSNSSNWNNLYDELINVNSNNWNSLFSLNSLLSSEIIRYNSLYNELVSLSSYWDTQSVTSFIDNKLDVYNNLYDIVNTKLDLWNTNYNAVSSASGYYFNSFNDLNNVYNLITSNSSTWNDIINSYSNSNSLLLNISSFNKDRNIYDNFYSILSANSSIWYSDTLFLNSLSTFLFDNSPKWIDVYDLIIKGNWVESVNYYNLLSSTIGDNNIVFSNLYNVVTATSSKWVTKDFINILSSVSAWDSTYNTLILDDKYNYWNTIQSNLTSLSSDFYNLGNKLNKLNSIINSNLYVWDNKIGSSILTGNSANWYNTYATVCSNSSNWNFEDKPKYASTYNYISSNSAKFIDFVNLISTNSSYWDEDISKLTPLSGDFLSGNDTTSFSALDLSVYGNTYITGNLSAYGTKISIDTTLNTTSGFNINNSDNNSAVSIDKVGGGAIFKTGLADNTVLYVKAAPKTVGINLSSISDKIGDVSNISLTVSGNISATGYVYPFPDSLTRYSSVSTGYETAYSYVTSNSAAIDSFILNTKPIYDSMVTYINGDSISSFSAVTIPYYNTYLNNVNSYSSKISTLTGFIVLSASELDKDYKFLYNYPKYDNMYSVITSNSAATSKFEITHYFGHSNLLSSQKVNVVIQDNIKIKSWTLISDVNTVATIDFLSSSYINFGKINFPPVSLTNSNPATLTMTSKNSATDLDSVWSNTYLPKGSILQFKLTNNSDANNLLINLIVEKQ